MIPLIIVGSFIAVPVLLITLLRSSAAVAFLALCAGIVLLKYVGADSEVLLASLWPQSTIVAHEGLNLTLLFLPLFSTMILLRKSVSGTKLLLNLVPALAVGGLVALSAVPQLSVITSQNIMHTVVWKGLVQLQDLLVGVGTLVSLLLIRTSHKKSSDKKKSH